MKAHAKTSDEFEILRKAIRLAEKKAVKMAEERMDWSTISLCLQARSRDFSCD